MIVDPLALYNTLSRSKARFTPLDRQAVRLYVCGPTVYDLAHIGNARPVVVFDVLFRLLRQVYGENSVIYTRNITDVDDKINARAARDFPNLPINAAILRVTEGTNAQFQADVSALGCLQPTHQPRATEHLDEMRALIERLVARGFAYVAAEHVLFSPEAMNAAQDKRQTQGHSATNSPLPRYGALANRSLDEMIAGARVDVAPYKRDVTDFVLWKPSQNGEPGWPSPCGIATPGRPGWHIECSAMSMAKLLTPYGGGLNCEDPLKNTFDIHAGGIDLVFPHHENEIAQSCCAFGSAQMAQVWMHNGFLQVEGRKMSKSDGNFITLHQLLAQETFGGRRWPGQVLRFALLKTHYRQPLDFTQAGLVEAEANWRKLTERAASASAGASMDALDAGVFEALADDLNTPAAITRLHAIDNPEILAASLALLGIAPQTQTAQTPVRKVDSAAVEALIAARNAARAAKDFPQSDHLRDQLVALGVRLMDGKDAAGNPVTRWEVAP